MFCPTQDGNRGALLALLPRGRAWRTGEGGPEPSSTIYKFWDAAASVFTYATDRLCALALEMFCATQDETNDLWMLDYGLPDACDPFPDLCTKVAAIGGTRCEYYVAVAARGGWTIDCAERRDQCGTSAGCGKAGFAQPSVRSGRAVLVLTVHLSASPAYTSGPDATLPLAGRLKAGRRLSCGPDIGPLICLIERVVHAEILVIYKEVP